MSDDISFRTAYFALRVPKWFFLEEAYLAQQDVADYSRCSYDCAVSAAACVVAARDDGIPLFVERVEGAKLWLAHSRVLRLLTRTETVLLDDLVTSCLRKRGWHWYNPSPLVYELDCDATPIGGPVLRRTALQWVRRG